MRSDTWVGTLLSCNIQVWFSHNSGLFLHTATLRRTKTSRHNCLFTIWPHGTNSWWTMPFQSKNTTNITLIFDWLIRVFFGWGDPFIQSSLYAWLSNWNVSVNVLPSLQQNFTNTSFFKLFHCHFFINLTNSSCTCSVQQMCSTNNAHSKTGQMAVCCQT